MMPLVAPRSSHSPENNGGFWKSGKQWPLLVVGLLLAQFCISGTTIYLAHSDPHFGVEPNYYEKAVHWDDTARQRETNRKLGWKAAVAISPDADGNGRRQVTVTIMDADGAAVQQAKIDVESFHHLSSSQRAHWSMAETEPGTYAGTPQMPNPGVWELRFVAMSAGQTFTFIETTYVP